MRVSFNNTNDIYITNDLIERVLLKNMIQLLQVF